MSKQDQMTQVNDRSDGPRVSRMLSFGVLLGCAILLHGIVFTTLETLVPIDDAASSRSALVIESGVEPMNMLVDAR